MSDHEDAKLALRRAENFQLLQPLGRSTVLLRIWQYPTFTHWTSWTVITANQGLLLRRLIWTGHAPAGVVEPVLIGSEAILPRETWKLVETGLMSLQIKSLKLDGLSGLDGTVYGVEYSKLSVGVQLTWWQAPPAEWIGMSDWWQKAISAFEGHLPTHIPQRL
jgi:hypothetical protein